MWAQSGPHLQIQLINSTANLTLGKEDRRSRKFGGHWKSSVSQNLKKWSRPKLVKFWVKESYSRESSPKLIKSAMYYVYFCNVVIGREWVISEEVPAGVAGFSCNIARLLRAILDPCLKIQFTSTSVKNYGERKCFGAQIF